jgi:hypothetical protein
MASKLRRSIALGPGGTIRPGSYEDYRYGKNRAWYAETRTQWVHLYVDWPSFEPTAGSFDSWRLSSLDAQVNAVRADKRKLMFTLYQFPSWANGIDALTAEALEATMPDRRNSADPDSRAKPVKYRYPDDLSESGAWGRFVEFIMRRYAGRLDVLEICNEPNYQMWPQQGPSTTADPYEPGPVVIDQVVAQMFVTAQAIQTRVGSSAPILAGPGCADTSAGGRLRTPYDVFTNRLLNRLAERGLKPGPKFAYTHHNYTDITHDQGPGSTAPDAATTPTRYKNRAAEVRRRLVNRWPGWPDGKASSPQVMLTEGGATLPGIAGTWGLTDPAAQRQKQAELMKRNWDRMATNDGDGAGIAMLSQYELHTDPNYDCGLCEHPDFGGATRPAFATWKSLPSYV